jgi:hypothetical protein
MPIVRPDRKGLPDPPPEEELSLPRSDSYLRLSDAIESQQLPGSYPHPRSPSQSKSELNQLIAEQKRQSLKLTTELTPPDEVSREETPARPATHSLGRPEEDPEQAGANVEKRTPSGLNPKSQQMTDGMGSPGASLRRKSISSISPPSFHSASVAPEIVYDPLVS